MLLVVLTAVVGLYLKQGLAYFSVRSQAEHQMSVAMSLEHQNRALLREQQNLLNPATIQHDARALGMVRKNERAYAIIGVAEH